MAQDHLVFIGWRVEDKSSRARYRRGSGIHAGDSNITVTFNTYNIHNARKLRMWTPRHLDWRNEYDTPLISFYADFDRAMNEANRRVRANKANVVIHEIQIPRQNRSRHGRVEFRRVRKLMKELGGRIPDKAYHNTEHEFVFLKEIPDEYIVESIRVR